MRTTVIVTRLRLGRAQSYARLHSEIPEHRYRSLLDSGVVSWEIWRYRRVLIHVIVSAIPFDQLQRCMEDTSEPDTSWDRAISMHVKRGSSSPRLLWRMDDTGQTAD